MRIVCGQTILMKYHTLILLKTRKDVAKLSWLALSGLNLYLNIQSSYVYLNNVWIPKSHEIMFYTHVINTKFSGDNVLGICDEYKKSHEIMFYRHVMNTKISWDFVIHQMHVNIIEIYVVGRLNFGLGLYICPIYV